MADLGSFNPEAIEDDGRGSFEVMPAGEYVAQVIESDLVPTKSGNGQMLKLTFEIIEGPCQRRRVWQNLNIANASPEAQQIGQRDLKRLCEAVGHQGVLSNSEQLHFKPLRVRLGIERRDGFDPRNDVKGYKPFGGGGQSQAQQQQPSGGGYQPQQQRQAAGAGNGNRPWSR